MFEKGDLFWTIPEPDVREVKGLGACQEDCMFEVNPFLPEGEVDDFNQWLIDSITVAKQAFGEIGFQPEDIPVNIGGMTGFAVAGLNNPDWGTFLDCALIEQMGGVVVLDHNPPQESSMLADLTEANQVLAEVCPEEYKGLGIGEFSHTDPEVLAAYIEAFSSIKNISLFNYWSIAGDSNNELVEWNPSTKQLEPNERFEVVEEFFKGRGQRSAVRDLRPVSYHSNAQFVSQK